ncbi:MAG: hypothetical protein K2P37_12035, partial [Oscillospiraceae bacterium]|nr:hypothetical protein [Oscillospiraceae bacterium]
MVKFKKWMSLALATVMCIGLLAACGGDNSKTPDTQDPGTTAPEHPPDQSRKQITETKTQHA